MTKNDKNISLLPLKYVQSKIVTLYFSPFSSRTRSRISDYQFDVQSVKRTQRLQKVSKKRNRMLFSY